MLRNRTAKACAIILLAFFISTCCFVSVSAETPQIVIDRVDVDSTGHCEVIGHTTSGIVGTQVSFLSSLEEIEADYSNFNMDNVIYIDQVATGNNGTFLIQFQIDYTKGDNTAMFKMGSSGGEETITYEYDIPELPPDITIVENNSVMYGRDIFYVPGAFYKSDKIADSLVYGGNKIYFKLGDEWYDLMDEDATDNSFLVSDNAVKEATIEALEPRYYYGLAKQITLKYTIP